MLNLVNPVLTALQLVPPFVLLNTPPCSPAYTILGPARSVARALTNRSVIPIWSGLQLTPPFVVFTTPPKGTPAKGVAKDIPAYIVLGTRGSIANALINTFVNPVLAAFQLAPAVVVLKTPLN